MKYIRTSAALIVLTLSFYALGACGVPEDSNTRPPANAGQFYPSDPNKLRLAIQLFLKDASRKTTDAPIAIIVPHAGYLFAGQIYADAYRQVAGRQYDVVVILGTNHTTAGFSGVSLGDYTAFRTPLGTVAVDEEVVSALLAASKLCVRNREVHVQEHSIEVQIPFIQTLFPKAKIVPAVIHPPDLNLCLQFGEALGKVLKNRRALIVISSDFSHYPDSHNAAIADRQTLKALATLDLGQFASVAQMLNLPNLETRACGEAPILAGITAAKILGARRSTVVSYANSGDTPAGDQTRTVGYAAVVLTAGNAPSDTSVLDRPALPTSATPLQSSEKKALLSFARETINRYLTTQTVPLARGFSARMDVLQGVFVTLKKHGQLRGCIGHIYPDYALGKNVGAMAIQAAFNDPRFRPVTLEEMKDVDIELSVLTPLKSIPKPEEIVVGRDGVILSLSRKSAVFLPQVAPENKWGRKEMLDNLCEKAGLDSGCWKKREARFQVFQADVFSESQFKSDPNLP